MQLFRVGIVGISARDDTRSAGTARAGSEKCIIESHAFPGKAVDIRCFDIRMTVGATIIPCHIIGDKKNEVGFVISLQLAGETNAAQADKEKMVQFGHVRSPVDVKIPSVQFEFYVAA
jgi:hypothetical protein